MPCSRETSGPRDAPYRRDHWPLTPRSDGFLIPRRIVTQGREFQREHVMHDKAYRNQRERHPRRGRPRTGTSRTAWTATTNSSAARPATACTAARATTSWMAAATTIFWTAAPVPTAHRWRRRRYRDVRWSSSGVKVSLATGRGSGGDAQGDILSGIENLFGSDFADTLDRRWSRDNRAARRRGRRLSRRRRRNRYRRLLRFALQGSPSNLQPVPDRAAMLRETGSRASRMSPDAWDDDTIVGDAGANVLDGNFGNDLLFGGDGDDDARRRLRRRHARRRSRCRRRSTGSFGVDTASYATSNAGVDGEPDDRTCSRRSCPGRRAEPVSRTSPAAPSATG